MTLHGTTAACLLPLLGTGLLACGHLPPQAAPAGIPDGSVDRIEGGYAIIDDGSGEGIDVPLSALPSGVREGDAIRDGQVDREAAAEFRRAVSDLLRRLHARTPPPPAPPGGRRSAAMLSPPARAR